MRNRYDRYSNQYVAPIEGANIVYQPLYDSSEANAWAKILEDRQKRSDFARQNMAQASQEIGGIKTYAPELLNERLSSFNSDVKSYVDKNYDGDYALAANDVVDMIAKERGRNEYKFIAEQNKQAELFDQARMQKLGAGERFIPKNDPKSINLREAIDANDFSKLQAKYLIAPDYDHTATELIKDIPANVSEVYESLNDSEKELFKNTGYDLNAFIAKSGYASNFGGEKRMANLSDKLTTSLYSKHSEAFDTEAPKGMTGREYAQTFIENKIPQLKYSKSSKDINFYGDKATGDGGVNPLNNLSTVSNPVVSDPKKQDELVKMKGNVVKSIGSLNNPEYFKGNKYVGKATAASAIAAADALNESSESVKNFATHIPTISSLYKKAGIDAPKWIKIITDGGTPVAGAVLLSAKTLTKATSSSQSGLAKMYTNLAKTISGVGVQEDAVNLVKDFEDNYGTIPVQEYEKDGKKHENWDAKLNIAINTLMNQTATQGSLVNLPLGDNEANGSKLPFNAKSLNDSKFNRFTEFRVKENGEDIIFRNKKDLADHLDISIDELDKSSIQQYDPNSGLFVSSTYNSGGDRVEFQVGDDQTLRSTGVVSDIKKDLKSSGYSFRRNNLTGNMALSVNMIEQDANGQMYVKPRVVEVHPDDVNKIIEWESKNQKASKKDRVSYYQSIINRMPQSDYLENYSVKNYKRLQGITDNQ